MYFNCRLFLYFQLFSFQQFCYMLLPFLVVIQLYLFFYSSFQFQFWFFHEVTLVTLEFLKEYGESCFLTISHFIILFSLRRDKDQELNAVVNVREHVRVFGQVQNWVQRKIWHTHTLQPPLPESNLFTLILFEPRLIKYTKHEHSIFFCITQYS